MTSTTPTAPATSTQTAQTAQTAQRDGHVHGPIHDGDTDTARQGKRAVFRIPGTALIGVLMLFMCMFPFAAGLPYLLVLLLVPIVLAVWIIRTRTDATEKGLTVRTLRSTRELPWESIKGFTITPKSTIIAVLDDDTTVPLPSVRTRHLPVLSLVSGGRIPDPSGVLDRTEEDEEDPAGSDGSDTESAKSDAGSGGGESDRSTSGTERTAE